MYKVNDFVKYQYGYCIIYGQIIKVTEEITIVKWFDKFGDKALNYNTYQTKKIKKSDFYKIDRTEMIQFFNNNIDIQINKLNILKTKFQYKSFLN